MLIWVLMLNWERRNYHEQFKNIIWWLEADQTFLTWHTHGKINVDTNQYNMFVIPNTSIYLYEWSLNDHIIFTHFENFPATGRPFIEQDVSHESHPLRNTPRTRQAQQQVMKNDKLLRPWTTSVSWVSPLFFLTTLAPCKLKVRWMMFDSLVKGDLWLTSKLYGDPLGWK